VHSGNGGGTGRQGQYVRMSEHSELSDIRTFRTIGRDRLSSREQKRAPYMLLFLLCLGLIYLCDFCYNPIRYTYVTFVMMFLPLSTLFRSKDARITMDLIYLPP